MTAVEALKIARHLIRRPENWCQAPSHCGKRTAWDVLWDVCKAVEGQPPRHLLVGALNAIETPGRGRLHIVSRYASHDEVLGLFDQAIATLG